MGRQTDIKNKYWVEFLKWYKTSEDKMIDYNVEGNSFHNTTVLMPVDDLFWYWLTKIKSDKSGADDFMDKL